MNELIKTTANEQGEILVSGRELHEFLEVGTEYAKWMTRMIDYGFVENLDYAVIVKNDENPLGGRPKQDHALKIDMAKEISMIQRNEKGKEARQYFITVEKQYKLQLPSDPITLALEAALESRKQIQAVQTDVKYLKDTMRIDGVEQFQLNDAGKKKALAALGGKDTPAYNELSRKVFAELWRDFKKHFTVPRYSELPKMKYDEGMQFISIWEPNTSMKMEIQKLNGQRSLF
ncbi:ORF6C domain-containing protein [Solibacillus isronensis]|uniref:ORF6C domain-containing protein n=1 Tax=Solibacillus isronensis TaxID=412383 RepID=UPI0039A25964